MDLHLKKLEEFISENKKLYNLNIKLKEQLNQANKKVIELETNVATLDSTIYRLKKEVRNLEHDLKSKEKVIQNNILFMKSEYKRKDILNNKLIGSTKDTKIIELKKEVNLLFHRNNLLCEFIKNLFDKKDLDFLLFYKLLEISDKKNIELFLEDYKDDLTN
ncbi:hypothetical protein NCER_100024 [Vairimorpha ceranae BRL01]|uniref:Uncharacterized protein n=2 Tax=Vairimorpha ceranae TaxID=40302 RepID=C4V6J3_VAIC1|nr:hypothetical protein AAJ76_1400039968 [Vairimorpha ceranae]EEQ83164.1 hypothetical protein NCER_100024 [Vairimorpha ceranae BRL01]KAF5140649.1 hypothetical protein G9O61_00g011450 [Vairimorpha ceranae]KKO75699.1 hypothetical protein AAJ76_1400039968 [Vairimorpha ceranae]